VVVYGLDADLIVLSLWASATMGIQMDLFREETEFNGAVKSDLMGEEQFLYMNVNHLATELHETKGRPRQDRNEFLTDFVALMNLLGNDFVAHGMALKIRDEGIEKLLDLYYELKTPLLLQSAGTYRYNPETLLTLFRILASQEPAAITKCVKKKLESRVGITNSRDPEDLAMARYNDLPVTWAAERCLVEYVPTPDEEKPRLQLHRTWRQVYDKEALWGADPKKVTETYLSSLAWTLAYYAGEPVDTEWYYPWLLPPRFETIVAALEAKMPIVAPTTSRAPLKPLEQLAMVLPQTSFSLLPRAYASLPAKHPHAWPVAWSHFSLGRRFLWECEPLIPLIQPDQMRKWLQELS
jgi:5'-3' exonuclease